MNENLFQNNPEFTSLSKFFAKITKNNPSLEYLNNDEIAKLRSLVDRAISKLKRIYNISSHFSDLLVLDDEDETQDDCQISAVSVFSLISQSLYILSKQKQTISSDDELIVSLQSRNEKLEEENRQLKNKVGIHSMMDSNDFSDIDPVPESMDKYIGSSDGTMGDKNEYNNANNNSNDNYKEDYRNGLALRICNKLKLSKKTNNEDELISILAKEINISRKIKKEIIRHYNLNINQNNASLSNIIQSLDKHVKHEVDSRNDLRSELAEATEGLSQLQKELEYITKSVAKKDDKIIQLRSERNEARQQLNELLDTIKKSNYNTSRSINMDEDKSEQESTFRDEPRREAELEEVKNELYKTQESLQKKKQKIEKLKKRIEVLEENKLIASMNQQAAMLSNLTNSIDNIEASLNKSQSKLNPRAILNKTKENSDIFDEINGNEYNVLELKKQLINMKDLLNQKEDQLTSLKSFVSEIASQYENASNELCEESRNKSELARSVQLLLDANQILETLLETSNQQKDELKIQLENSIFKAQTSNNGVTNSTINNNNNNISEYPNNTDQFLIQKVKKITDEVFNEDEDEMTSKINKIFDNENHSTDSELILEICTFIVNFISGMKNKMSKLNKDLNDEKSFSSHLYSACLGQLRFIMDLSDSRLMQNWILGDENEEWIRSTLQVQIARMESFFDNYIETYSEHKSSKENEFDRFRSIDDNSNLNPIQQIEKGIFEELLPISKSLNIQTNTNIISKNNSDGQSRNINDALLIPLSTRITEFLSSYKNKMEYDQMSGEDKDLYVMLVQSIAANNVLQIFATEAGNQCKSQFNEIRNLQSQLSIMNRNSNIPTESANTDANSKPSPNNEKASSNDNADAGENMANDGEVDKKKKKRKKDGLKEQKIQKLEKSEADVYEEIKNIKKILRKGVSRMINNHPNNSNDNNNNENKNEKQIPFSDLFICLKCIEKAERVSFDRDKYVRKLEKHLVRLDIIIKDTNNQLNSIKDEMSSLQNECQIRISDHEQTVAKLSKQLAKKENELKFLKEAVLMLNYGDASALDRLNKREEGSMSNESGKNNEEEESQKIDIRQQYEEVVNGLRDEVDALEQKVTKMTEESKNKVEQIKDKSKKKQEKLLSTINFLTNQKKEIEEEQVKEREGFQKAIEKSQAENSQLKQKVDELNVSISTLQDKLSKSQIENKLLKSRLKNEEEKSEREKSLIESRMKLKAFSIENAMKDKIEDARKQQQTKHRELIIFIFNLFADEVDLLMKNEENETDAQMLNQETEDSIYSFLQNVKTKMSRLERSSFACDSVMNELNDIRRTLENFISTNSTRLNFDDIDMNNKCSRIIKDVLDTFSLKVMRFQSQENELKRLKMDSSTASKVIEKAKEAIEWENWCRRIQRFITEGFETKQISPSLSSSSSAPISPTQILRQKSNNLNLNLVARVASPKEMRNKLEEAVYAATSGNIKKVLRKLEILRTEKIILTQYHFNSQIQQCLFISPIVHNNRNNDDFNDDYNGRASNISFYHLIIVSLIVNRIEKLSGHVQSFFSMRKKISDPNVNNNDNVDNGNQNYQMANGKTSKPIFSQFISPL
ncbi:hypothetical protein M9Y10_006049 [Tritrichomonas musculus]|uniref:Viral A-type inclusion protein n=1 Tax=Tritrichomonas musculus TaxID=1915356 RepID=A0ABR2JDE7_9EUKA